MLWQGPVKTHVHKSQIEGIYKINFPDDSLNAQHIRVLWIRRVGSSIVASSMVFPIWLFYHIPQICFKVYNDVLDSSGLPELSGTRTSQILPSCTVVVFHQVYM